MNILYNNSPRSKSAIELLGIEESNLYYVSYDEFIKSHPELIGQDNSYKLKAYNRMEDKRRKYIEDVIKKRKELTDNSLDIPKKEESLKRYPSALTIKEEYFGPYNEEKEKFRQMLILKSKINYELKLSEKERKNKEKYLNKEKNIDELKFWKEKMKREKHLKEQVSEMQRQERRKIEYEEYLKYLDDIKQREQRVEINVEKTQKEKFEENKQRKNMSKQKEGEFKEKKEKMDMVAVEKLEDKREKLRLKYENQKKNLDEINKEKNNENQIKSKNTEEKSKNAFNLIFQNENDYYNYKTNQLKLKQITVKENKKRMTEEICERNKEQDMLYNQKEKDISNLFINKELKIIKKGEDFKKKYNNLLLRKKELDNLNKQNIKLRYFQLKEKENKCKEVRLKEEREKELFRKKLLEKIYESQNNMTKKREKNHLDLKEKFSDLHLKMEDISENLKIREKLIEIKKIKHFEKMEEKNKKVEQMKYAKLQFQNHRKEVSKNLEKDKEKLMNKYYLLKLNRNRSKDDILKELFPEDYKDGSITFEKAKQKSTFI